MQHFFFIKENLIERQNSRSGMWGGWILENGRGKWKDLAKAISRLQSYACPLFYANKGLLLHGHCKVSPAEQWDLLLSKQALDQAVSRTYVLLSSSFWLFRNWTSELSSCLYRESCIWTQLSLLRKDNKATWSDPDHVFAWWEQLCFKTHGMKLLSDAELLAFLSLNVFEGDASLIRSLVI